jgi:hypothetical protein
MVHMERLTARPTPVRPAATPYVAHVRARPHRLAVMPGLFGYFIL